MNDQQRRDETIMQMAVLLWGRTAQEDMAIEEMAELTQAIVRRRRGRAHSAAVIEEVADVRIMLDQLRLMVGPDEVDQVQRQKMDRLGGRIVEAKTAGPETAA